MIETQIDLPQLLIIDDEPSIRKLLTEVLKQNYDCVTASSAEEGLDLLRQRSFSLVISDINMIGITGLEMAPQILTIAPDTVVIMMSGAQTIETAVSALRVGAFDYLVKPFDMRLVEAAVRRGFEHYQLRISKRQYETELELRVQERTAALTETTRKLETEIAERNRAEQRLNYMRYHDVLTELPNRILFRDRLGQALSSAKRDNGLMAVLLLSIDRFKEIGETLGSACEDELICAIAERLTSSMREGDTLAYWGSDEFAMLFNELERTEDSIQISKRLQSTFKAGFKLADDELYVTASIGIALHPLNGQDEAALMKNASAALAQAKQKGGNTYQFYAAEMNARVFHRLSLESSLRRAIEREELVLYYQPKVSINTWQISGAEALIRWNHPEKGLISPAEFIPLAEETGLIAEIGEWVLRNSCRDLKEWSESSPSLTVSSNISAKQFQDPTFFSLVMSTLDESKLDPSLLELELTESSIMTNPESALRTLHQLQGAGIRISIDDFGTGFSSLSYLKRLPINILKIDKSFVHDASADPDDAALVMAIITLAHNLKLKVVAEGVESDDQLRFLHLLRCDEIQGYLFSMPVPANDFKRLLLEDQFTSERWTALRRNLLSRTEQRRLSSAA
jgi:diguanylate cyclase (GGDEF)-like protein